MRFLKELLFEVDVAESASRLVARGGQRVVVLDAGQLDCQQVLLGRCAADDECDVVGRAGCRAEVLHLLYEEGEQCAFVLYRCLRHGVEVRLVGRTATLSYHNETVLGTFASLDVNLCGQVALRVHLVVHIEGSILRVAQIVLRKGVEHATGEGFFVLETCPDLLAFLAVNDSRACVLAERQYAFACRLCIAQELEGDVLVVLACIGVFQDLCNLQVMLAAQHELHIVESLLSQQRQCFGGDLYNLLAFELADGHAFLRQEAILRLVLAHLEHWGILEFSHYLLFMN